MQWNKKLIGGCLAALVLLVANIYQYLPSPDDEDDEVGAADSSRPARSSTALAANTISATDISAAIQMIDRLKSYPAAANIFVIEVATPVAPPAEPDPMPVKEPEKTELPVPKTHKAIKVLAVSGHIDGVSALIEYGGQTRRIRINDVLEDGYRVKAISNTSILLSKNN